MNPPDAVSRWPHHRNSERSAPREDFLYFNRREKITFPRFQQAQILPGIATIAVLNQTDVAWNGPASNIIEELSLIETVKKMFQHGSFN
jgi:hypothetical protein